MAALCLRIAAQEALREVFWVFLEVKLPLLLPERIPNTTILAPKPQERTATPRSTEIPSWSGPGLARLCLTSSQAQKIR